MISLFQQKNKSSGITITIDREKLFINGKVIELPIDANKLKAYLGEPSKTEGNEIVWKDLGISTNPNRDGITKHLSLHTAYNPIESKSESEQKPFFIGRIIVEGVEINIKNFETITKQKYTIDQFTYRDQTSPCLISISYNQIFDKGFVKPKPEKDKYAIQQLNEDIIDFKDFGFKIAIIQELMYYKELLQPKFDLREFAAWYDKRKIDIEEEGYDPIPEVTQYFKNLPVPKRLASEITEIYQDGGNDIYLQLISFAGGDEDYWDIESIEDLVHFPNLKEATLCYARQGIVEALQEKGVKAKWL